MNDKDIHNNVDALLGHLSIEKPSVHVVKKSHRGFYNFIILLAACLSIGFCLVLPVWSDKTGLDIIQEWINSNDSSLNPLGDDPPVIPEPYFYEEFIAPLDSFGMGNTTFKTVNWSYFKQLFNAHCDWMLEYKHFESSGWTDGNQYMTIEKEWNETLGGWKFNLIFDVPVDVYSARFTFGCDLPVLNYVERDGWQVNLNYTVPGTNETYNCYFNWSDMAGIPGIVFNKGRTDDMFWFRFKRDNIPAGHYEFDPTFGQEVSDSTWQLHNDADCTMVGIFGAPAGSGTANNITIIVSDASPTQSYQCALYEYIDYGTDFAGDLIKTTEIIEISSADTYVFDFAEPEPELTESTNYYLVVTTTTDVYGDNTIQRSSVANIGFRKTSSSVIPFDDPLTDEVAPFLNRVPYIYCSYTEGGGEWENTAPTQTDFTVNNEVNESVDIDLYPQLNITTADADGNDTIVYWSTNGSAKYQINGSAGNRTCYDINFSFADSYDTKYWVNISVNDTHDNVTKWYCFTTKSAPESRTNQRLGNYWFLGGNISSNNQLGNFWFLGGNVSNNNQFGDYWFLGGNISSNNQIANYWFLGGNISSNNQLGNFWFLGGNKSVRSNQQLGNYWFLGGNISSNNQIANYWFLGGNTSNNNQLGDYWFLGGNTTARINEQLGNYWFLGGNETGNNQLGNFWFLGGNETSLLDIYNEYPSNESNIFDLQPTIRFSLTNPTGDPMNYTIYTGNSTANCTHYLDNISSVNNGTFHYVNYFNATNYTVSYYWRVYAEDGTQHVNETFHFTPSMQGGQVISSQGTGIAIAAAGMMISVIALVFAISKRKKKSELK